MGGDTRDENDRLSGGRQTKGHDRAKWKSLKSGFGAGGAQRGRVGLQHPVACILRGVLGAGVLFRLHRVGVAIGGGVVRCHDRSIVGAAGALVFLPR